MSQEDVDVIENLYRTFFLKHDKHPFFEDLSKSQKITNQIESHLKNIQFEPTSVSTKIEYIASDQCKPNPIHLASPQQLSSLMDLTKVPKSWDEIQETIQPFYSLALPDTTNGKPGQMIKKLVEQKKKYPWQMNILILGGGPMGLFALNYLQKSFSPEVENGPRVGVLLLENRVHLEHWRMPYVRNRVFAFGSSHFSFLLPGVYCSRPFFETERYSMLAEIRYLELLLYALAYQTEQNMYFTSQFDTWSKIEQLMKKGDFDVVIDATGGRIEVPFFKNVNSNWLKNISLTHPKLELKISTKDNLVELVPKKNVKEESLSMVFLFGEIVDDNGIPVERADISIQSPKDHAFVKKYLHEKCLTVRSLNMMLKKLEDDSLRGALSAVIKQYPDKNIKFWLLRVPMSHSLQISDRFKLGKKDALYVGLGDTIFSSHFVIGAGLARMIPLTARILQYLPNAYYKEKMM